MPITSITIYETETEGQYGFRVIGIGGTGDEYVYERERDGQEFRPFGRHDALLRATAFAGFQGYMGGIETVASKADAPTPTVAAKGKAGHICPVCKKEIEQKPGPGRARKIHAECKGLR